MSRLRRFLNACLIASLFYQASWAADLLQAYRQAAESDPVLKAADARLLATKEVKPQAKALLLPNVVASGTLNRNFDVNVESSFPGTSGGSGSFNSHNVGITLTQPLFDQQAWVRFRQADSVINQAEADFLVAQQDLILRLAQAYFGVLSAQDTLSATTANKEAIARQLEQAKRRFEVGLITITDVLEAQARYDLAVTSEIDARNALADSWEALRVLTGQNYTELHRLNEKAPFDPPKPENPDAWVIQALKTNPQLFSSAFAIETARENINLQKAGHYPTVDLTANYFDSESDNIGSNGAQIGVQFNVPIYLGGAVVSRTREAAFQYEAARENLDSIKRQVIRQIRNYYRGVIASISRIKSLDRARTSNESALEATQAGFDVGTRTIVDVLDAQRELYLARRDYSVARYDYILNYLNLLQAAGTVSQESLAKINVWLVPPSKAQQQ
jgi:outer membrane protein